VNYIKKVYEKAKIKLKKEDIEPYNDPYEYKSKPSKANTARKPKYRFC
jgi:hypothetical protein